MCGCESEREALKFNKTLFWSAISCAGLAVLATLLTALACLLGILAPTSLLGVGIGFASVVALLKQAAARCPTFSEIWDRQCDHSKEDEGVKSFV
jgi:hypothetical protein